MIRRSLQFGSAIVVTLGFAAPAAAQYRDEPVTNGAMRDGLPAVMDAPPPEADPSIATRSRFSSAYARARSPRFVIFWNRAFTDEVATAYEGYARTDARSRSSGEASSESYDGESYGEYSDRSRSTVETRVGTRRVDSGRRDTAAPEAVDFDVEQAFTGALSAAGARLIDRTSILRTTGMERGAGALANVQDIETRAVLGKAEIVLEVVQMDDPRADDGVRFKVVARDVAGGRILVQFATDARPPVGRMPLVAGASGFVRATPRAAGPRDIGRQLAIETMAQLAGRL